MHSRYAAALLLAALAVAAPHAQEIPPAPQEKPKTAPAAEPAALGQPVNIKLDVAITDQTGPGEPVKKVVTLVVADRANGSVRSVGSVRGQGRVQINVDARPQMLQSGGIRVLLGLEYTPRATGGDSPTESSSLNEQIGVVLQPGKPLIVSQAADPASERKITVELTATLLK